MLYVPSINIIIIIITIMNYNQIFKCFQFKRGEQAMCVFVWLLLICSFTLRRVCVCVCSSLVSFESIENQQ